MRRVRRAVVVMSAIAAAMVLWLLPGAAERTGAPAANIVRGAYHVHTNRSDGSGTPEQVAAAAAGAGLQFVILTDHGDGTRAPEPPQYRSGVLVVDAVEVNTAAGHVAVLGIPQSPYPLAGTAAAVLEDVHRLGGFGIAAHPGSPRPALSWREWEAPIDGVEWINGDSEWRDEPRARIARALLTYLLRAPESMAILLDYPAAVVARWDELNAARPTFAFAGVDAHARLGLTQEDPDRSSMHLPLPGYGSSFRTLTNHVILDAPFSGDAGSDAARLLTAVRHGRSYSVTDALATPGALRFTASSGHETSTIGDTLTADGAILLRASLSAPPGTTLVLVRNGERLHQATDAPLQFEAAAEPAFFRVEAYVARSPGDPAVPWIMSNAIYVRRGPVAKDVAPQRAWTTAVPAAASDATTEAGEGDQSELARPADASAGGAITWRFALRGGVPSGQFAALQIPVNGVDEYSAVRFRVSASRPVRAWAQMRVPNDNEDRWGSTFYADRDDRVVEIPFSAFRSIGAAADAIPLDRVRSLLLAVDTLNSLPGTTGELTLRDVVFLR